jgi:hypothetical protein
MKKFVYSLFIVTLLTAAVYVAPTRAQSGPQSARSIVVSVPFISMSKTARYRRALTEWRLSSSPVPIH